ncbi:hypothetical protein VTJ04DRAFT_1614 [Mycothermus thermophilus]|uniref:uncharacterized protein n=1 Tax=Humicola insolens TaxID=85995 RepID=UPI0037425EDE
MSWTDLPDTYDRLAAACRYDPTYGSLSAAPKQFPVTIFEANMARIHHCARKVVENKSFDQSLIRYASGMIDLCQALDIPHDFLNERMRGVCHSFGTRPEGEGYAAWFRYLCRSIDAEGILQHHRWYKSAFYLKKHPATLGGGITLVMFGPMPAVTRRVEACVTSLAWLDVLKEPFVLFDLILDALFKETDLTVLRLLDVVQDLEQQILKVTTGYRETRHKHAEQIDFAELHGWARNLVSMGELIDWCLMVVDDAASDHIEILTSPLFKTLWTISIPITVTITLIAMWYRKWALSKKKPTMTVKIRLNAKESWSQFPEQQPTPPPLEDRQEPKNQDSLPRFLSRLPPLEDRQEPTNQGPLPTVSQMSEAPENPVNENPPQMSSRQSNVRLRPRPSVYGPNERPSSPETIAKLRAKLSPLALKYANRHVPEKD